MGKKQSQQERRLESVVKSHESSLLAFIRRRIEDKAEAEDVLQDVFEELFLDTSLVDSIEEMGAWLLRVARNKIFDRFRRRRTVREHLKESRNSPPAENGSSLRRPDDEWLSSLLRAEILAAIEALPPDQREVFVFHELEGLSFDEIARKTGVPLNTLLSRKRYAVIFLRNYLKEIHDELES